MLRFVHGGVAQHQDELVAAVACRDVVGAQRFAQDRAQFAQHLIAGGMSEGVVNVLELVHIGEHHHDFFAVAHCAVEQALGDFIQPATIQQPRQRIGGVGVFQLSPTGFDPPH